MQRENVKTGKIIKPGESDAIDRVRAAFKSMGKNVTFLRIDAKPVVNAAKHLKRESQTREVIS